MPAAEAVAQMMEAHRDFLAGRLSRYDVSTTTERQPRIFAAASSPASHKYVVY
jgi:hypothetical protein